MAAEKLVVVSRDARAIVEAALGADPGPMTRAKSMSANQVFLGADVVVKILSPDGQSWLSREIALVPLLPAGVTAPLLASGEYNDLLYACYARVPGESPGVHLPN